MRNHSTELNLKAACSILGCSRATFIRWATVGVNGRKLAAYKVGARWRVTTEAIEEFKSYPGREVSAETNGERERRAWAALKQIERKYGAA